MLNRLEGEMKLIEQSIEGLVALEDSLKGEGGNAIRSFYEECHLPFLQFHSTSQKNFITILERMDTALDALEPDPSGFIHESFLEGEIEQGLTEIAQITESLTDEANSIMDQVADIVGLPHLDDSDVQEGVKRAKIKRDDTVTALHEFDTNQTDALTPIETDLATMDSWISDMAKLFRSGLHDVHFQSEQWAAISLNNGLKTALQQEQESLLKACIVNNDLDNLIGKEITPEIFGELEGIRRETVVRGVYVDYELLNFHVYANSLIVKEYKERNHPIRYEVVKEVGEELEDGNVQFTDGYFEGTPLAILDYLHPKSLIQKGFKKFVFAKLPGIKSSKYKGDLSGKKNSTAKNKDTVKPVSNMDEFFSVEFGKTVKSSLSKTNVQYDGQSIYKVLQKTDSKYLKKGYGTYLDALHKDHLEVIDKTGKVKYVLNLDGTYNSDKTKKAAGRVVKGWR